MTFVDMDNKALVRENHKEFDADRGWCNALYGSRCQAYSSEVFAWKNGFSTAVFGRLESPKQVIQWLGSWNFVEDFYRNDWLTRVSHAKNLYGLPDNSVADAFPYYQLGDTRGEEGVDMIVVYKHPFRVDGMYYAANKATGEFYAGATLKDVWRLAESLHRKDLWECRIKALEGKMTGTFIG